MVNDCRKSNIHVFKNFAFVFNNFTFEGLTSSQPSVMISAAKLLKAAKTMEKPRGGIKLSSKAVKKEYFIQFFSCLQELWESFYPSV